MASKHSHRFLMICSTLAAAAGCGQILGISDYEIDPKLGAMAHPNAGGDGEGGSGDTNSGATTSKGGSGGKTNTGGSGGKTNTAGTSNGGQPPGAGGAGGEPPVVNVGGAGASAGGEGGAGGAGTEEKFQGCDGTPFTGNEAVLRSCILRVGCEIWRYPDDSISRCISQDTQNAYEGTKCTLDATSCADITACEGTRIEDTFCTGKPKGRYCNGDDVVYCDTDFPHARNCVKEGGPGGTCHDFGSSVDLDGFGTHVACILPSVTTCTATTDSQECGGPSNAFAYQCQGKIAYGSKCSNFAASCQDVGGDIGCYYPLNDCTTEGVVCANKRATWCDGTSKVTYDCSSVGLGCKTEGDYYEDSGRQCTAPGCTPDDIATCKESCDGSKLSVCYGGAPVTVDCKDYGFTTCNEYDYECTDFLMNDCLYDTDTIHFAECE